MKQISSKYVNLQLALFLFTLVVIVWGAWVRISHSGDGCGESWPLCAGEFIPTSAAKKTWIEYTHRLMSGSYGLWVIFLYFYTRSRIGYPALKKLTLGLLVLMIIEALLGAKLVLLKLVGTNDSMLRLFAMALHQINSLLLTGTTFFIYLFSRQLSSRESALLEFYGPRFKKWKFFFIALLIVAMVGSWASLSNTLHPSDGLWEGLMKDFADDSHYLVKLRFLHPLLASLLCFSVIIWKTNAYFEKEKTADLVLALGFLLAFIFGWCTLIFLAPVWMKLTHLSIAHLLWAMMISSVFDWSSLGGSKIQSVH